ncbi:MAG: (2Fe-2S)-binding protein, partial [Stellaceae bacterium]
PHADAGLRGARGRMSGPVDVTLTVNRRRYALHLEPRRTLLDAIRDECGLTGTHMGCEHGVCGACTVIVDGDPVRACLMFAVQAEGSLIRTVEGLAEGGELGALQRAFIAHHAVQCGFCTPGFLMLATAILEHEPDIGGEDLLEVLSSNLCRCTGYQGIVAAVKAALAALREARK